MYQYSKRQRALRKGYLTQNERLLSFSTLMELEWSTHISANALSTLAIRKLSATQLLPLTSDLKYLNAYIEDEVKNAVKSLRKNYTPSNWNQLAVLTLCRLILFNKRRSGEVAKITLQQYVSRPKWNETLSEELKESLTNYELKLAERLEVVKIVGKRGRKIAVLLTPIIKNSVDLLNACRYKCGISTKNEYIYARGYNALSHIRGHDCIRKVVEEVKSNLQQPDYISSTKLRKYVATVCQLFSLTETEVDWLARHLGHDIAVHREFCRLQEDAVELTKVSRLLLAIDKGEASNFSGKSLKDINVEDLPPLNEVDEEENGDDDDDDVDDEIRKSTIVGNVDITSCKGSGQSSTPPDAETPCSLKGAVAKKKWTGHEKEAVIKFFRIKIKNGIVPGKNECLECIQKNPVLENRGWRHVKFFVKNHITKIKKLSS